ncbi:MAG TPA: transcription antitermination factor NusB [Steroidobacteraceae bacterium]|nr:transcription antitermination factor NusB [Steroidobacteraceae bacterium]
MSGRFERNSGARTVARKLALQALYRWQLNSCEWQDLVSEFATDADMPRADAEYFEALVAAICGSHDELDAALAPLLDRKPAELDPVEHALLLIGSYELQHRHEVPFRVVINEAVNLARRFGATDGHKFVNGVLDRAARLWRIQEH